MCRFTDLDQFQLGTLSHMICAKATGYQELPDWPEVAPDPLVRNVEVPAAWTSTTSAKNPSKKTSKKKPEKTKSFYSDESSSSEGAYDYINVFHRPIISASTSPSCGADFNLCRSWYSF